MATKRPTNRIPAKRNPAMRDEKTLSLGLDPDDNPLLTPEQRQDKFMSRWMSVFHPYSTWPRVFRKGDKNAERIFHDIKLHFKHRVIESDWSEKKYVMVVNSIIEARSGVNSYTLDKMGIMYDEERLPLQVRLRREQERG